MIKRVVIYLIGIFVFTLGIALSIQSGWGVGPWDAVFVGANKQLSLTVGTWSILIQIGLLFVASLLTKRRPVYESGLTILVRGVFLDFWLLVVFPFFSLELQETNYWMGATGLLLLGSGIGFYLLSNLPKTPIDVLMSAVQEKTGYSMQKARLLVELFALFLALVLVGPVGIGTLATAFFLAPIIQRTNQVFRKWINQ